MENKVSGRLFLAKEVAGSATINKVKLYETVF